MDGAGPATLEVVERVLQSRVAAPPPGSYVAGLLAKGEAQICRKIGEEAIEVVTAALGGEGDERVVSETADLWFHTMVLLARRGIPLRRVFAELARRQGERRTAAR
jgi:phosphoribosyl-ATP pyrophosphohydrolase